MNETEFSLLYVFCVALMLLLIVAAAAQGYITKKTKPEKRERDYVRHD